LRLGRMQQFLESIALMVLVNGTIGFLVVTIVDDSYLLILRFIKLLKNVSFTEDYGTVVQLMVWV